MAYLRGGKAVDDKTTTELLNLKKLLDAEVLTQEEFERHKAELIGKNSGNRSTGGTVTQDVFREEADDDLALLEPDSGEGVEAEQRFVASTTTRWGAPPAEAPLPSGEISDVSPDSDSRVEKTPVSGCSFPGCLLVVLLFGWIGYLAGFDVSVLSSNTTAPSGQQKASSSTGSFNAEARKAKSCCDDCGGSFSLVDGCSPNSMCYGRCLMGGDPFPGLDSRLLKGGTGVLSPSQAQSLSMSCCSSNGGDWVGDDCYSLTFSSKQGFISCHGSAVVRFPSGKEYTLRDHARKFAHCRSDSGC